MQFRSSATGARWIIASVALAFSTLAAADITYTPTVNPDPTSGSVSGSLVVGPNTSGALVVDANNSVNGLTSLTANGLVVGSGGTGSGMVTVSGTGVTLNLTGPTASDVTNNFARNPLELGQWGTGTMTVSGGAMLNAGYVGGVPSTNCLSNLCNNFIGQSAGSLGILTLTGTGTTANFAGGLIVGSAFVATVANGGYNMGTAGQNASGTIVVQAGATLNTNQVSLGIAPTGFAENGTEQATGTVAVDGAGSLWHITPNATTGSSATLGIGAQQRGTGEVTISNGGQLQLDGTNSWIGVGDGGIGTLTITSGSTVSVEGMGLGNQTTGQGTVTVGGGTGTSTLTIGANSLGIGNNGTALSTFTVDAGGVVTLTGATSGIGIANAPGTKGALVIDGGQVNVQGATAGVGVGGNGIGTLTITNGGSLGIASGMSLGNSASGIGTATVGGGTGTSTLTIGGGLTVGQQSTGISSLTINSGGVVELTGVNPGGLAIAQSAGSKGNVTVDGTGQLLLDGATMNLGVGNGGTGTLTITGGQVTLSGAGGNMSLGGLAGSSGTVVVDGGSLTLSGANSGMGVGNGGIGNLTITNGGSVSVAGMGLGNQASGVGTVTVGNGTGTSTLNLGANGMTVGWLGTGMSSLIVNSGGNVSFTGVNSGLWIGNNGQTNGTVMVDAGEIAITGSNAGVSIGNGGTGAFTIQNGGQVGLTGQFAYVGVGNSGNGTLTVQSGGQLTMSGSNASMGLGGPVGNIGTVVVDGGTLNLSGSNSFTGIGEAGTGSMTIGNGGSVSAATFHIGNQTTGVGSVTVGNASGTSTLTVANGLAVGQNGDGSLTIQSGGQVNAGYVAVGNNSTSVGEAVVAGGGTLTATTGMSVGNASAALSTLTVSSGGAVLLTGANAGLSIANVTGSNGAVTIDGGSLTTSGTNASIGVGNNGTGALTIQNGGAVTMAGQNFGVSVGNNQGSGTLLINTGGSLTTESLSVANQATSTGIVNIVGTGSGPQTVVTLNGPAALGNGVNPLQVGNWGNGTMTVSGGAIVNVAIGNANCGAAGTFCANYVGNGAGSTGSLTLTGPNTTMNLAGNFVVGGAAVFTNPPNSFTFGTPGGTTNATVLVQNGATLNTSNSTVSQGPGGTNATGGEHTIANVTVDGGGSKWSVTPNAVSGAQAFVSLAARPTATATLEVKNGAMLVIDGFAPTGGNLAGINMSGSGGQAGGTSTINVTGTGSAIVINQNSGDSGVINIGRNGGTATLNISDGGQVYGGGTNGLPFVNVARQGSTGTLNVDGAGSSLAMSGVASAISGSGGIGASGTIGRESGSVGYVNVTNGGAILMSDGGQAASNGGVGFTLGRDAGAEGYLTIAGAGSSLTIQQTSNGSTRSPGFTLGGGGYGEASIIGGGAVLISDTGYGGGGITIARDTGSSGMLTVSGTGTTLTVQQTGINASNPLSTGITVGRGGTGTMLVDDGAVVNINGTSQRTLVVGNAIGGASPGGIGTLVVSNGASVSASWFAVGNNSTAGPNGGTGIATIDNATVNLDGYVINPVTNAISGASVAMGRGAGSYGSLDLVNAAQLNINTTYANASVILGGTSIALGGTGTINMSGGSSIEFTGTGATPHVTVGHSGTGIMTMDGSSVTLPSDGNLIIGATAGSSGRLELQGGSTIQAGNVTVGQGGTGLMTMIGGSSVTLASDGKFIIGATAGSSGQLELQGGSTIQAGALFGMAHDGTNSTGGFATLYLDDGSHIYATDLYLGAGGCLGGDYGTLHGNFVMKDAAIGGCAEPVLPAPTSLLAPMLLSSAEDGFVTPFGILRPGRSPGTLTFDGTFTFISGTIELQVEADGFGGFVTDRIIFANGMTLADLDLTNANIEFVFLGDTDPEAFNDSGLWNLDTFFLTDTGSGLAGVSDLGNLDQMFSDATFTAQSDAFVIEDFTFNPADGVTSIVVSPVGVPEPGSLALMLLGTAMLLLSARRQRFRLLAARRAGTYPSGRSSQPATSAVADS